MFTFAISSPDELLVFYLRLNGSRYNEILFTPYDRAIFLVFRRQSFIVSLWVQPPQVHLVLSVESQNLTKYPQ